VKSRVDETTLRILILIKLDASRLFERLKYRVTDYLYIFSVKRTREHFPAIFKNRYDDLDIEHLKLCSQEVLIGLDQFYSKVDDMRWYLNSTEDMGNTVDDKIQVHLRDLETFYEMLNLYIDAELGAKDEAISAATPISDSEDEKTDDFTEPTFDSEPIFETPEGEELSAEISDDLLKELSS
jgi:hypothetical protein